MLNLSHEASTISKQFIIWKHDIGELLRTLTKQKLFFIESQMAILQTDYTLYALIILFVSVRTVDQMIIVKVYLSIHY